MKIWHLGLQGMAAIGLAATLSLSGVLDSVRFGRHAVADQPVIAQAANRRPTTQVVKDPWTQKNRVLKLYDKSGIPFTTYVPATGFAIQEERTAQGLSTWFYSKLDEGHRIAYVQVFFPAKRMTVAQLKQEAIAKRGVFQWHQWKTISASPGPRTNWSKAGLKFEKTFTAQQNIMGNLYLGESQGRAFYVMVHYPADYGDGFAPEASWIVQYLQPKG